MRTLLLSTCILGLLATGCATTDPEATPVAKTRADTENCVYERGSGSNIKRARCGPGRDDRDRLATMGTVGPMGGPASARPGND